MEPTAVRLRVNLVDLGGAGGNEKTPRKLMHLLPEGGPAVAVIKAVGLGSIAQVYYFADGPTLYTDILVHHWYDDERGKPIRDEAGAIFENTAGLTPQTPGIVELAEMASRQAQEVGYAGFSVQDFVAFILQNLPN